tara:strand:- start:163 stop:1188 length:1026 start_codon:yes stop_codon:yes gene_type:complete
MAKEDIPVLESKYKGIPVTDVKSAQAALMAQLQSPATEQPVEEEMQEETQDSVSEQDMESESVESDLGDPNELSPEDLVDNEQEVEDETPDKYTIKVDGKDTEVTLEELQNGYSRQADYTRKSQVLAEQRKKADEELAATQQERQRYLSQLEQFDSQADSKLKEYAATDWNKLKEEDPMEYMAKRDTYRELQENKRLLKDEKTQVVQKQQQEQLKQFEQAKQVNYQDLVQRLPEWGDPEKGSQVKQAVKNYAVTKGFTEQELNTLIDARSVEVLHKAMLYENLLKAKISNKKTKVVPKVQKPGTGTLKSEVSSDKVKALRAKAKRTGNVKDAAKLLESFFS